MIIDIHTHTFPDKIALSAAAKLSGDAHIPYFQVPTAQNLSESVKKAGIDLAVILPVATSVQQVEHINTRAAQQNEAQVYPNLLSFGCMHPDYENYRQELRRMRELGLKGVKIHPVYQDVDVDDIRYLRIMECAAAEGLIVLTHAGADVGFPGVVCCSPKMCRHVVEELGSFPFIVAHMGGLKEWTHAAQLLADTDVYLDTAFSIGKMATLGDGYWSEEDQQLMQQEEFVSMVRAFGAHRILFGSDSPWTDQAEDVAALRAMPLPQAEIDMILGGNAQKLLKGTVL